MNASVLSWCGEKPQCKENFHTHFFSSINISTINQPEKYQAKPNTGRNANILRWLAATNNTQTAIHKLAGIDLMCMFFSWVAFYANVNV